MKKIHSSILIILILCLVLIGIMTIGHMFFGKTIPDALSTGIFSVMFALIGYIAGKNQ